MSLSAKQLQRYNCHLTIDSIGKEGQIAFGDANILIAGLGGLGCPAASYLCGAGIGSLTLCDSDVVETSNLPRQTLYREDDYGQSKVVIGKRVLNLMNTDTKITIFNKELDEKLLENFYTVILDCTDNIHARLKLNAHCYEKKIPLVSASATAWDGHLIGFDFRHHGRLCLSCFTNPAHHQLSNSCIQRGVVNSVVGMMGTLQATTVLRLLLGHFDQHGEMIRYDGKSGRFITLTKKADPKCLICSDPTSQSKEVSVNNINEKNLENDNLL
tara:strand:- start:47 stop:859 length:813 start_codon:yes stop_codon:yes gene_type:complete